MYFCILTLYDSMNVKPQNGNLNFGPMIIDNPWKIKDINDVTNWGTWKAEGQCLALWFNFLYKGSKKKNKFFGQSSVK